MSCPWAFAWIIPLLLLGVVSLLGFGVLFLLILGGIHNRSDEADCSVTLPENP
jgi:hypothetical protein